VRTRIVVEPKWLDTTAAATYASVHPEVIRKACRAGALEHRRVSYSEPSEKRNTRGLRFLREWLDEWLLERGGKYTCKEDAPGCNTDTDTDTATGERA
jgi:hypothetical protein